MEENIDPLKTNSSNQENPLTNESVDKNIKKDQPNLINKDLTKNLEDPNNPDSIKKGDDEIKNKKANNIITNDIKVVQKKEIPIEKKPFNEFINDHLLPSLISEFKERGFDVNEINLKNTLRPITGDKCWVIYCEINDICNFWLSFEKEDISSSKSISLSKSNQKPSVIESFLIDEKRITLKLIISRILQRLNGQKLIGIN